MKMEKLLENKISRRFKVRRLGNQMILGISWNISTAGTVSLMKIMSIQLPKKKIKKEKH